MAESTLNLLIVAVFSIVGSGGIVALIMRYWDRGKVAAETSAKSAEANEGEARAVGLLVQAGELTVGLLRDELERAFEEIRDLRGRILHLEQENERLKLALSAKGVPGGRRAYDPEE